MSEALKTQPRRKLRSTFQSEFWEEAPRQTEPEVIEKWIPEEKMELWEIRAYRDRLERDKNASQTRTRTGVNLREPQRLDPGAASEAQPRSVKLNYKAEMDEKFKQQQGSRSVLQVWYIVTKIILTYCEKKMF